MNKSRSAVIVSAILTIVFAIPSPGWTISEQSVDPYGTFAGSSAGSANTSGGDYNAFLGYRTGYANSSGDYNTFAGARAGYANTTGGWNTFIGYEAGKSNTTGVHNTFIGYWAGLASENTNYNTYIGSMAGANNHGDRNVFIGAYSGFYETASSDMLIIANSITATPLIYGEFDNNLLKINGRLVFPSDKRLKEKIEPLKESLNRIMRLKAVSYEWKDRKYGNKGRNPGLIAQDVEAVLPELVHTGTAGYKALAYDRLAPIMVEAIKEQQALINGLEKSLESESLMIDNQQETLDERDMVIKDLAGQLSALRTEVNRMKSKKISADEY